ncbi:MAG: hypothetical protein WAO12_11555 [Venatoribacter sp.]
MNGKWKNALSIKGNLFLFLVEIFLSSRAVIGVSMETVKETQKGNLKKLKEM